MLLRDQLVREARTYLGTRFRHQGRSKTTGVDCAGLIIEVAKTVVPDFTFDFTTYDRYPDGFTIMNFAREYMQKIEIGEANQGDVLIMFDVDPTWPCHLAFVATDKGGKMRVIHSACMRRKVVEHVLSDDWKSKITAAFRFNGVA